MRFYGEPNLHIIDYEMGKEKFILDENGIFETDDPKLIDWIKKNKNFLHGEITFAERKKAYLAEREQALPMHCKKCDFRTSTQVELMAHHRSAHPKSKVAK